MIDLSSNSINRVMSAYLRLLDVKVINTLFLQELEEHPYYPSLLSLTDTCKRYNIPSITLEISKQDIFQLEPPFIAYVQMGATAKDLVLVTDIDKEMVHYMSANNKRQAIAREEFAFYFKSIIWIAETNADSGDPDYQKKSRLRKKILFFNLLAVATLCSIIFIIARRSYVLETAFLFISVLISKLVGVVVTSILLSYQINKNSLLAKAFCFSTQKTTCNSILDSSASRIFGITWSEVGFFYFAATALYVLLPVPNFAEKIKFLGLLNLASIPYVLYSFYYQWRVAKKWCSLCLSVQLILIFELMLTIYYARSSYILSSVNLSILFCFLIPVLIWYSLKPILVKANSASQYIPAYKRLKYNPEIFDYQLKQQLPMNLIPDTLGILLGKKSNNEITKVCSPFCKPCSEAHNEIEKLLEKSIDINVRIIFLTPDEKSSTVAKYLLSYAAENDILTTRKALAYWYANQNKELTSFSQKYPVYANVENQDAVVSAMNRWCVKAGIDRTPTYFINGYSMPDLYEVGDFKLLFE